MNIIETIDQPHKDRGKILIAMANCGFMKPIDISNKSGIKSSVCGAQLVDIIRSSSYIELERKRVDGIYQYRLISMRCKMSESRLIKETMCKSEPEEDSKFKLWRKTFSIMNTCHA